DELRAAARTKGLVGSFRPRRRLQQFGRLESRPVQKLLAALLQYLAKPVEGRRHPGVSFPSFRLQRIMQIEQSACGQMLELSWATQHLRHRQWMKTFQ